MSGMAHAPRWLKIVGVLSLAAEALAAAALVLRKPR